MNATPAEEGVLILDFDDNRLLTALFGEHDRHLARIEQQLNVAVTPRGNRLAVVGTPASRAATQAVLDDLYTRLRRGMEVGEGEVDGAIRMAQASQSAAIASTADESLQIRTRRRMVSPRSPAQAAYLRALQDNELVFGLGPAGTGKTYLAVAVGVSLLLQGKVERLILSRPAVEAGERLGFLPGDLREKVDPYMRPLYDALHDMLPADQVMKRLEMGEIEIAPLAFMRGRTLAHAFVILDEAQNASVMQMKMFLTRLGEKSRMVVTGDPSQVDLPAGTGSGLADAAAILRAVPGVGFVRFTEADVVRHELVTRIVQAYNNRDAAERQAEQESARPAPPPTPNGDRG